MPIIDLHTHTQPLSHDSLLSPDQLIEAAKTAGLDGVCLTEHDFFWDGDKVRELQDRHNFLVVAGVEVNTEDGHFLVFGLAHFVYGMHRTAELVTMVNAAGGALVAAHPYRRQLPFDLRHDGDWTEVLERAAANPAYAHVCAMEAHNGRGSARENAFAREICARLGLPAVAGSDCHERADIGRCATEFERHIGGLSDLIAELRAGRCRPVILSER